MKHLFKIGLLLLVVLSTSCVKQKFETFSNDPSLTRIYTLDNGLKVYMSVNKDEPRINAHIAVRVGGKNDPHETTGLAHYFEHLMFKGTEQFGTQNFELEKPLLDEIENQFEKYRQTTDEAERAAIYKVIDSISYEASKIAIPNEYDKLMAAIGASGTNAYTSYDQTVYTENIPSNQLENWAKIQSDRFSNNVIRGFHTELETVYEEKNMSLTRDGDKLFDAMFASLFKKHPYGTQTILGTQQHLKNPSITNIKKYYKEWYVANNMAICLSGDLDPDATIEIINKYFGQLKPNPELSRLKFEKEDPITEPVVTDVYGLESESILLAWRFPASNDKEIIKLRLLSQILYNGVAGLIDLDVNQQQKVIGAGGGMYGLADYSIFLLMAQPKHGQTLDQVKDILLCEIEKVKKGEFDDNLLKSVVNNYKRYKIYNLESINGRVNGYVDCFVNDISWGDYVNEVNLMSAITKDELVAYANEYFKENYAYVRKNEGKDKEAVKISKPKITPIFTNRDTASAFLRSVQSFQVKPIEPVFVDYQKDMSKLSTKNGVELLYKKNVTNELFSLVYLFDFGRNEDKVLAHAVEYLDYLGTSTMTPEQIKQTFYSLACDFTVTTSTDRTYVTLSGLNENMKEAVTLFETLLADAQPNPDALKEMNEITLKDMDNAKLDQSYNVSMLSSYARFGPKSPATNILTKVELNALTGEQLVGKIHNLNSFEHSILYYGPLSDAEIIDMINTLHKVPEKLTKVEKNKSFVYLPTTENSVILAPYDAKQIYLLSSSNRGEKYDPANAPMIAMYNEYFGSGMNSIVFQEMREARGLAYSARAGIVTPNNIEIPYIYTNFIATQNDKMMDAINAFDDIINNMPVSENAFKIAKESLLTNIRTSRIVKSDVLWSYISSRKLGMEYDINKDIFEKVQGYTMKDVIDFQQKWVKGRKYTIAILGDAKDLDLKSLEKIGKIKRVETKEIFGY